MLGKAGKSVKRPPQWPQGQSVVACIRADAMEIERSVEVHDVFENRADKI